MDSEHIRFESKGQDDDDSGNATFNEDKSNRKDKIQSIRIKHMQQLEGSQQLYLLRKEISTNLKNSLTLPNDKNAGKVEHLLEELR